MSGECDECGEHAVDCKCNEILSRLERVEKDLETFERYVQMLKEIKKDLKKCVKQLSRV